MNRNCLSEKNRFNTRKPSHGHGWALQLLCAAMLAVVCVTLAGCGPHNFLNDNDTLRRENMELQRQVASLQESLDLRVKQIQQSEAPTAAATQPAIAQVSRGDIPRVTQIDFDKYSGPVDTNSDAVDDTLRLYVLVQDQRGRFLPAIGQAVVQVVTISPESGTVEIAKKIFSPREFDEAYRTGMTGTHYTLEIPLPANLGKGEHAVTVKLSFMDANTGQGIEHEQAMKIHQ